MKAAIACAMLIGCAGTSARPKPPPRVAIVRAVAQRGATRLYVGDRLIVGSDEQRDTPGAIVISALDGTHAVTRTGWALGIVRDRAMIAELEGAELRVMAVGLVGDPVELARVHLLGDHPRVEGATAGDGQVAVVADRLYLFAADGKEVPTAVQNVIAIAGDPHGAVFAVFGSDGLALLDGATGAVRWTRPLADVPDFAFVTGKLAVRMAAGVYAFALATGDRELVVRAPNLHPRNVAFAPSGEVMAWSHDVHPSDIAPVSMARACQIFVVTARDRGGVFPPVLELPDRCYAGTGMAFVGTTLWIAARPE